VILTLRWRGGLGDYLTGPFGLLMLGAGLYLLFTFHFLEVTF
jgi:hypothetical protein